MGGGGNTRAAMDRKQASKQEELIRHKHGGPLRRRNYVVS